MVTDMFDSCVRASNDIAGVFEYDGDVGYFYLYEVGGDAGEKVLGSIHILSGTADFEQSDVSVKWDAGEKKVGLFIRHELWAVFDGTQRIGYGGGYAVGARALIPPEVTSAFHIGWL